MTTWTRLDEVPLNAWFRRLGPAHLVNNNDWLPVSRWCPSRGGYPAAVQIGDTVWNVSDLLGEWMYTMDPRADAPVVHRCGKTE